MKNNLLKVVGLFALAGLISFSGCKYEDGPGISLRSKRDRFANEWILKDYTYKLSGNDTATVFRGDLLDTGIVNNVGNVVFITMRNGFYKLNENPVERYTNPAVLDSLYWINPIRIQMEKLMNEFSGALGLKTSVSDPTRMYKSGIAPSGRWSFDEKHSMVNFDWELSTENHDSLLARDYEILELREDKLKLKWTDEVTDTEHKIEFEPLNDEDFFL